MNVNTGSWVRVVDKVPDTDRVVAVILVHLTDINRPSSKTLGQIFTASFCQKKKEWDLLSGKFTKQWRHINRWEWCVTHWADLPQNIPESA
jgi:hypoxanthine phosphoribosyltransferase